MPPGCFEALPGDVILHRRHRSHCIHAVRRARPPGLRPSRTSLLLSEADSDLRGYSHTRRSCNGDERVEHRLSRNVGALAPRLHRDVMN